MTPQEYAAGAALFFIFVAFMAVLIALAIAYALHLTRKTRHTTAELAVTKDWHC